MPQVESVIRGRDMFSFVARYKEDMHLFMTEVMPLSPRAC